MRLVGVRGLAVAIAVGAAAGTVFGAAFALATGKAILYGIGAGLMAAGIIALGLGLLGATEPSSGWTTGRGETSAETGRRSLLVRLAEEDPDAVPPSSPMLALWGLVVGGTLLGLAMTAFALA